MLHRRLASIPIIRITHEVGQAVATSLVLASHTHRVGGAGEGVADGHTLEHAQDIRAAGGGIGTVGIACAIGEGRLLAGGHNRVPHIALGAVADGMASRVDLAQLVGSADHVGAEVHALPGAMCAGCLASKSSFTVLVRPAFVLLLHGYLPLRLAAHLQVARVAKVAIGADAGGTMVIRHAQGIGSTLNLGAGVHALAQSLAQLEADLRVPAVGIVATLAANAAAIDLVLGISHVAHGADALSGIANGSRATGRLGAEVLALTLLAAVTIGTLHSLVALTLVGVLAEPALDGLAAAVGIAGMTRQAQALESSGCV